MTEEEAYAKISVLVNQAETALKEATVLAQEHGIDFSFHPAGEYKRPALHYNAVPYEPGADDVGWFSSSHNC